MFEKYVILSASRMTDMPAFYPEALINGVNIRTQKGYRIHTIVLWTKHIRSLFQEPLYSFLTQQKISGVQLFVHLTITGMAGIIAGSDIFGKPLVLEPNVPPKNSTIELIPNLIEFTGKSERIRVRIDPIVKIKDHQNRIFSNYSQLEEIIRDVKQYGIKNFTFSFLENNVHTKVNKRFGNLGAQIISPDEHERLQFFEHTKELEKKYNITITACCVPGMATSRCIDGYLLEMLHDLNRPANIKEPRSRKLCGCTHSIDIGGWPPKPCPSGCLYCYSRPLFVKKQ